MLYDPRWPWHAAAELGAQVTAPPQYWRSQPREFKDLFAGLKFGARSSSTEDRAAAARFVLHGAARTASDGPGPCPQPESSLRFFCKAIDLEITMKTLAILTLAAAAAALPAAAATNVGISIGINAPGQYGRIDINNYPQPILVSPQPIVYAPSRVAVYQRPIYLYVPQAHQSNWGNYCGRYSACGQPVYFVQEAWVRDEYRREHDNRDGRKKFKQDKHDRGDNGDRGRGNGKNKRGD